MMRQLLTRCLVTVAAVCGGGWLAAAADAPGMPGIMHVYGNDQAKLFTDAGIEKAKQAFAATVFPGGLQVTFDLYAKVPEGLSVPSDERGRREFFLKWARDLATADKSRGIYVLICRSPGYVQVIADRPTRQRGFDNPKEQKLADTLLRGFREAKERPLAEQLELRDQALLEAVQYIATTLKDTTPPQRVQSSAPQPVRHDEVAGGSGIAGWICLGLMVLLGIWLIIGIVRAISGAAAAPAGAGGGGFFSSLLGGLFGTMAGMWLYNSLFGGSTAWGSDSYGSDLGGGTDAAGAGDFSGDTGAGGSFDDGGAGGDFGGGDFGGGDFGGGDFGGGDF